MRKGLFTKFSNVSQAQPSGQPGLNGNERQMAELCAVPIQEALATLKTTLQGLSAEEAGRRLNEYGSNENLSHLKRLSFGADMFRRLRSPLIVQLLIIATVSGLIGEFKSAVIVGGMIFLSVGLSYILDRRSSQAVETLGKRVQSRSFVLRDGAASEVRISEIVPGDVVLLQARLRSFLRTCAFSPSRISSSANRH